MRSDLDVARLFTDTHESLPRSPELVGFSLSWELDYVNILNLLEFLAVPIRSANRGDGDPLIFGDNEIAFDVNEHDDDGDEDDDDDEIPLTRTFDDRRELSLE